MRIDQIIQFFSSDKIDRNKLENCLKEVGRENDQLTDTQGLSATQEELYRKVFSKLGLAVSTSTIRSLCSELDQVFLQHRPVLIDPGYISLLSRLFHKGLTLNISSNTAFVPGQSLKYCIQQDGFDQYFDFMLFSDQLGIAKPAAAFYLEVLTRVKHHDGNPVTKEAILHAGDNPVADIKGAGDFGFQTMHILLPADLFKLEEYV
jgi:putative hydrolase of the HAD superfamily